MTTHAIDFDDHGTGLPSAEQLVASCIAAMGDPCDELLDFLGEFGAPALDMGVTVMSARAALLGAEQGRSFYHHELRGRIPMPDHLEPEVNVWQGGTVPQWQDGALVEPKYFSFFQDAPFAAYNPNHRRKWRAHELIHGALGFFWSPSMTRFEFYVGARLNELIPVVHWYHLDEMFRPRCRRHAGEVLHREFCRECEDAARPFWEADTDDVHLRERAEGFARSGIAHFREEIDAIERELETGRQVETPRGKLNASSDAVGYLRGHWNRCTGWSFGTWVEKFLVEGVDYTEDLPVYLEKTRELFGRLLGGSVAVERETFQRRRARRVLQDVAYRVLVALEFLSAGSSDATTAEEALMPALDRASGVAADLAAGEDADWRDALDATFEAWDDVADSFPAAVRGPFDALGYTFLDEARTDSEVVQVLEGVNGAAPDAMAHIDDAEALIFDFVDSEIFHTHGRLPTRFAAFLAGELHDAADLARFEAWILEEPRRDEEAEKFGVLPDDVAELHDAGRLRLNQTYRRAEFSEDVSRHIFDGEPGAIELAAVVFGEELRLMDVDASVAAILDALEARLDREEWVDDVDEDVLLGLVSSGFVAWLPRP